MPTSSRRFPILLVALLCLPILWPGRPLAETTLKVVPEENSAGGTDADAPRALKPGDMVRLRTTSPPGRLKGTIKTLDDTQITVVVREGEELSVPWTSIKKLEVQVGLRHSYGVAALIGGGIGALIGLVIPNHEECFAPGCPDEEAFNRSQAVLIGGVVGALGGLWAEGASQPGARKWEHVRAPYAPAAGTSLSFGVTQDRDGLGVRLVLGF
jgi:hypothetical protein